MSPESSAWLEEYRKLLAEQAVKWAGHQFDEPGVSARMGEGPARPRHVPGRKTKELLRAVGHE